jgi:hypothetical protein
MVEKDHTRLIEWEWNRMRQVEYVARGQNSIGHPTLLFPQADGQHLVRS